MKTTYRAKNFLTLKTNLFLYQQLPFWGRIQIPGATYWFKHIGGTFWLFKQKTKKKQDNSQPWILIWTNLVCSVILMLYTKFHNSKFLRSGKMLFKKFSPHVGMEAFWINGPGSNGYAFIHTLKSEKSNKNVW